MKIPRVFVSIENTEIKRQIISHNPDVSLLRVREESIYKYQSQIEIDSKFWWGVFKSKNSVEILLTLPVFVGRVVPTLNLTEFNPDTLFPFMNC